MLMLFLITSFCVAFNLVLRTFGVLLKGCHLNEMQRLDCPVGW